jgi:hypothetical protein
MTAGISVAVQTGCEVLIFKAPATKALDGLGRDVVFAAQPHGDIGLALWVGHAGRPRWRGQPHPRCRSKLMSMSWRGCSSSQSTQPQRQSVNRVGCQNKTMAQKTPKAEQSETAVGDQIKRSPDV